MAKFKLIDGSSHVMQVGDAEVTVKLGDEVESDADLEKTYPGKFKRIDRKVKGEDAPVQHVAPTITAPAPTSPVHDVSVPVETKVSKRKG